MKKIIALLLVAVMAIGFCACAAKTKTPAEPAATEETTTTEPAATEETTEEPAAEETETTENQHFDKLTLEFVPSKDADVIITGTKNLPELLKAALLEQGYDVKDINITVGTNYEATGEAMAAGTVDLGWLPGGTYALFSDDVDVILTATRAGLSNDSEDPTTWNGEANKTLKNGPPAGSRTKIQGRGNTAGGWFSHQSDGAGAGGGTPRDFAITAGTAAAAKQAAAWGAFWTVAGTGWRTGKPRDRNCPHPLPRAVDPDEEPPDRWRNAFFRTASEQSVPSAKQRLFLLTTAAHLPNTAYSAGTITVLPADGMLYPGESHRSSAL